MAHRSDAFPGGKGFREVEGTASPNNEFQRREERKRKGSGQGKGGPTELPGIPATGL